MRYFDSYSRPIQFTYKGDDKFSTASGGCFSIITVVMICLYGFQQLIFLWVKPDYE